MSKDFREINFVIYLSNLFLEMYSCYFDYFLISNILSLCLNLSRMKFTLYLT